MDSSRRGVTLGKYSLVAEMARGGMGVVYLAQARGRHGFKKIVVVKELKTELADDERFVEMFLDEARLAARLNHRNIVQTTEVDQEGDRYFFVMEYLEGRTLHDVMRLKGERALPMGAILRIICDMLAGLHYAHELTDYDGSPLEIVHRDVSPRNVFVTYDGQVKLLDFGVAKAAGREQETQAGELKGRVPFMAPEHVSETGMDRRADVFSTGVLLREALTGVRTWQGSAELDILRELLLGRIPPLPMNVPLDPEAMRIVQKAMAPKREDRYQTAHEMRVELEAHVAQIDPTGSHVKTGEHISREFAEHRAQVKARIEEHVARVESMPPEKQAEIPMLPISSGSLVSSDGTNPSNPSASAPSASAVVSVPPISQRGVPKATPSMEPDPGPTVAAPTPARTRGVKDISIPPTPPKAPIGKWIRTGIAFIAVVAGLTAGILWLNSAGPETKKIDPVSTGYVPTGRPGSNPLPTANVTDARVEVTVRAFPLTARIFIDNVGVGEGPHTSKLEHGRHYFRASAPGYETRTEAVDVTATTSLNLTLEKEAGAER